MNKRTLVGGWSMILSLTTAVAADVTPTAPPWPYEYFRGEYEVPCPDDGANDCIWHRLVVDNKSANTLECRGRVAYDSANREQTTNAERRLVVLPNSRVAVLADTTIPDVKVTSHSLECTIRPPLDDSKLTPKCKPTLTFRPTEAEYPPAARRANEEGPVMVDFSLSDTSGAATDVTVAGSSLSSLLDASGVKYVSQFIGVTDCKHGRFRVPVIFRLQ